MIDDIKIWKPMVEFKVNLMGLSHILGKHYKITSYGRWPQHIKRMDVSASYLNLNVDQAKVCIWSLKQREDNLIGHEL